ncbi:AglZ/HisF2 family acetamidino modification protein [Paracoccaceae bacterium Fryx2]|nr:AglZ/HisF2 family acetamidino modification protein [Paracoccaceae bacterium Fryx2]
MLRPRLIACLLIQSLGLVKTRQFGEPKYVGDPINAVRIFNEKMVDELMVIDIDATPKGREPDYRMIANLANECRMPLCYGGGVSTVEQIERIIGLGVEKVALSAAALARPALIEEAAQRVGSQSVVVVVDIRKGGLLRHPEIVTHNATRKTGLDPAAFVREATARGAGEIVINNVDRDGMMEGYDLDLVDRLRRETSLPMTILGGAGSLDHVAALWRAEGIIGAAAGSLFVFKGKYRAVLINYPNADEKSALLARAGWSL